MESDRGEGSCAIFATRKKNHRRGTGNVAQVEEAPATAVCLTCIIWPTICLAGAMHWRTSGTVNHDREQLLARMLRTWDANHWGSSQPRLEVD